MSDTQNAVSKLAGTYGEDQVRMMKCKVDSVDVSKRTCMVTPINDNMASFPAYLMAEIEDGVLILPKVDSTVKVLFSNMNAPTVIQYSAIDKLFVVSGDSSFLVYKNGVELYGSNYGGVPIVKDPDNSNAGLLKKINQLENKLNDLISKFNLHTHILTLTSGTGTAAFPANTATPIAPITTEDDISNPKVKHGNT